jgi:hypothetical protein
VSPVLVIVLLVIVAMFVFAVLVGARGGLSSGGCLPEDSDGRRALFERWFGPKPTLLTDLRLTDCALSGNELTFNRTCRVELPKLPAPPRSWTEKIGAAFESQRSRLFLRPLTPPVHLVVIEAPPAEGPQRDPVEADLKDREKRTDVTFAPDGVRSLQLSCTPQPPPCRVDLSPPAEER